jgi:hypothetical protein
MWGSFFIFDPHITVWGSPRGGGGMGGGRAPVN